MTNGQRWIQDGIRIAFLVVGIASALPATALERVGRYSVERPGPTITQRDLLSVSISTRFPDSIRTVGQAIEAALLTTGYRLSTPQSADITRAALLALPLPATHREFRHSPVRHVLKTLIGPAFKLIEDPVHRLVSFERCGVTAEENTAFAGKP